MLSNNIFLVCCWLFVIININNWDVSFEMSNLKRNYGVDLIFAKLWFIEKSFEYEFWVCFSVILSFVVSIVMFMHTYILELGRTLIYWGDVQRKTMTISCSKRIVVQRGTKDRDKAVIHLRCPKSRYHVHSWRRSTLH